MTSNDAAGIMSQSSAFQGNAFIYRAKNRNPTAANESIINTTVTAMINGPLFSDACDSWYWYSSGGMYGCGEMNDMMKKYQRAQRATKLQSSARRSTRESQKERRAPPHRTHQ